MCYYELLLLFISYFADLFLRAEVLVFGGIWKETVVICLKILC